MTNKTIHDLDENQCRELLFEESFDFTEDYANPQFVKVAETSEGSGRWSSYHTLVVENKKTGCFYKTRFTKGLTEIQDERPFEYEPAKWVEVQKVIKQIEVVEYVEKESKKS